MAITNLKKDVVTPDKGGQRNEMEQKADATKKAPEQKGPSQAQAGGQAQSQQGQPGRQAQSQGQPGQGMQGQGNNIFMGNRGMGGRGRYMAGNRGGMRGGRGGSGGRYDGRFPGHGQGGADNQQQQQQLQTEKKEVDNGTPERKEPQSRNEQQSRNEPPSRNEQQTHNQEQRERQQGNWRGRGGRGGGGRGERREKIVHPPPQFTEDGDRMFTGRCRLFVGNLPQEMTQQDFEKMFEPYGEFQEAYISQGRGFGFIRMDTRLHAVAAKKALDGQQKRGRFLRVRFASHPAALKVKHLHQYVSNEMLEEAFQIFGEIEKAVVVIDEKGRPTGEGIVEFARKPGATMAINKILDGVFLMGSSPRPITVEPLMENDEEDGLPEKFMPRSGDYLREREHGARLAPVSSFEYEFGQKWKEMYLMHQEADDNLKRQFAENVAKLEIEQANAQMEYQTQKLREDLVRRQEELRKMEEQHQREMQMRLDMRRQQEDNRRKVEELRKQDEEDKRMHMERFQQQQQDRAQRQQEQRLRDMQERQMRQIRGEMSQLSRSGSGLMPGMEGEIGSSLMGAANMGAAGLRTGADIPAMKPPPAPPAALGVGLERSGRADIPNLLEMTASQRSRMHGAMAGGNSIERTITNEQSRFDGKAGNKFAAHQQMVGKGGLVGVRANLGRRDATREDFYEAKRARRF